MCSLNFVASFRTCDARATTHFTMDAHTHTHRLVAHGAEQSAGSERALCDWLGGPAVNEERTRGRAAKGCAQGGCAQMDLSAKMMRCRLTATPVSLETIALSSATVNPACTA